MANTQDKCICRVCGNVSASMICLACSEQIDKELVGQVRGQVRAMERQKRARKNRSVNGLLEEERRLGFTSIPRERKVKAA